LEGDRIFMIEVKELSKNYNELKVLKKISFTIQKGEIVGFLGPNGAGKTTTMKIITGYTAPSSGSVKINGLEVSNNTLAVKKQIGYLPESVAVYDDMTVVEYLKFIADIRRTNVDALKAVVKICGLEKMVRRPISQLSKGYRQRTCLAQALIHNPDILILDEPTSGLDPNQIAEIRNVIKKIGQEKTVVLSTHILQEVQATCDRVIIINEGQIVAQGTTQELERQAHGKQSVFVKMKGIKDKIQQLLLDLPAADEVVHRGSEAQNIFSFEIIIKNELSESEPDIRELIFHQAVKANAPILEMRQERISLEDVFRQLTK